MRIELRPRQENRNAPEAPRDPACPSCGDDLFTAEFGCKRCRYGQKSFAARNSEMLPLFGLFGLLVVGGGGVAVAGTIVPDGFASGVLIANACFVLTGACVFAFGIRAIQKPTSVSLVDSAGEDAFGMTRYGKSHQATASEGTTAGVICVIVGLALVIVGIFIAALAHALGIPTR